MLKSIYNEPLGMIALWRHALQLLRRQWLKLATIMIVAVGVLLGGWYLSFNHTLDARASIRAVAAQYRAADQLAAQQASERKVQQIERHKPSPQSPHQMAPIVLSPSPAIGNAELQAAAWQLLGLFTVMMVVSICVQVLAGRWALDVCFCDLSKQKVDLWQSFMFVLRRLHWLLLYALLQVVVIALGFVCLMIPGIALALMVPFGYFFVLYDRAGPITACKRAIDLVWGNWWRTLAVLAIPTALFKLFAQIMLSFDSDIVRALVSAHTAHPEGDYNMAMLRLVIVGIAAVLYVGFVCCLVSCVFQDLLKRKELSGGFSA